MSLLFKKLPHELKFVLIDPKGTEFEIYAPLADSFLMKIPKCEHPIITDVNDAILALNDLCELMDKRFDLLKRANVKNINEYNEKITSNLLDYADFIMTSGEDIEMPLVRLAQLAHSVGIHLVITTQRLTYNIITGIIRATFPTSIAFRVTTESESKVIIQNPDACKLLGKGDMLFAKGDMLFAYISELTRVQCAFVDEKEINRVIKFIAQQEINQK